MKFVHLVLENNSHLSYSNYIKFKNSAFPSCWGISVLAIVPPKAIYTTITGITCLGIM